MAVAVADGTITITTGAIGTTFTVSGLSFQPKALLFFWSGRATNGQAEADHKFGMGIAVSTTSRRAMTTQSDHGTTTTATDRRLATTACIATLTIAGAIDGLADLDAILSDGFRLIIDDVFSAALQVGWLALGGTDLTVATIVAIAVPAAPGDQDITVTGFTASAADQAVIFLGSVGAPDTTTTHSCFCLGAAAGSALNNAVMAGISVDAQATSVTASYCRAGESLARAFGEGLIDIRGSVTAWLTDAFRINWAEVVSGEDFVALCLKGGQYAVGNALTSTGTTNQTEGTPFTPLALLVASHNKAASTVDTEQLVDERSVGVATSPTSRRYASILDDDSSASSDIGVAYNETQMYANQSTAAAIAIEGLMDLVSFDGTPGFTYVMDDADPVAAFFWYLAMAGAAAGAVTLPPRPTTVLQAVHRAASY